MDPESSKPLLLGRQPILDRKGHTVAYELLFRGAPINRAEVSDDTEATANVIAHAFSEWDMGSLLGPHQGYVNVGHDLLMSDMIELMPRDRIILELLETIPVDRKVVARCKELRSRGFRLALDDVVGLDPARAPLHKLVDVVKIDVMQTPRERIPGLVREFAHAPHLLAEKVDSAEQAEYCRALGFDLFQGYFFARPAVLARKRAAPSQVALLRLLGLALTDGDNEELEAIFREDCKLSYNLMRLVNSVGSGVGGGIHSLSQAIIVLGRRQLQRWLLLLLYVHDTGTDHPGPLFTLAATRGKLMELLTARLGDGKERQEEAFMTGSLCLLDALLSRPMAEIAGELGLADDVHQALTCRQGNLGSLLALIETLERNDLAAVDAELTGRPTLSLDDLCAEQMKAMAWAETLLDRV